MADQIIWKFVHKVRRRIGGQVVRRTLCEVACIGLVSACGISFLSFFIPFYYAFYVESIVLGSAVLVGIGLGIHRVPTLEQAALRADDKGYQEKITTAFGLRGKEDPFSMLQKQDAVAVIVNLSVPKLFPFKISVQRMLVLLLLAVLLAGSNLLDSPSRQYAREHHAVQVEVKKEMAKVEKVERQLTNKESVSETEIAKVQNQLEQTKKELAKVESAKELQQVKERYLKKMQQTAEQTTDTKLRKALQKQAKQIEQEQEEQKKKLAQDAKQAMEQAKDGKGKEQKLAYDKVKDYAQTNGLEELEKQIEEYKQSDYSEADYVKANATLTQSLQNADRASKLTQKNSQSLDNRESNSSTKRQKNSNSESRTGNGNSANGNSQGRSNNGTGSNGGNQSGSGWNRGSDMGQEGSRKTTDKVTIPEGTLGEDDNLTGKANDNGQMQKSRADQSNAVAGNKVDYGKVSAEYKQKAYKQVDGASYPTKLKKQIRNYFDGLN